MTRSHSQLRRWFNAYNRKWFGSRLPSELHVFYAPDDNNHGLAVDFPEGLKFIKVDTTVAGTRFAKMVLLHEMNHHDTDDFGHGEKFQEGMKRLAKAGAFRNIW